MAFSFKKMSKKSSSSSRKLIQITSFILHNNNQQDHYRRLLDDNDESSSSAIAFASSSSNSTTTMTTPTGCVAIYVGQEGRGFLVPTGYLSHPLFSMLLEKANDEFGLDHNKGLTVPCSVTTFMQVLDAVECCNGSFVFGKQLVEELF